MTYGESASADYRIRAVTPAGMATEFELTPSGGTALAGHGPFWLRVEVPGKHNALNAAAAFATAAELGFDPDEVAAGLAGYRGAQRRMELKGEADSVRVLDSYAHHPTEIAADLTAARDIASGGRVLVVFQPHLFSRTRIFATEFGAALAMADEIFVLDVYAAREDPEPGVTGALIADAVPGGRAAFWPDRQSLPGAIADLAKPGDVVMTMGAGDVTQLGPAIVTALLARGDDPPRPPESRARADGGAMTKPAGAVGKRRDLWKVGFFGLAAVALIAGVAWALLGSSFLVVRTVRTTGSQVPRATVLGAAAIRLGTPLIRIDTGAIARRVDRITQVQSAKVTLSWPDAIVIWTKRRSAVFTVRARSGYDLVDSYGVVLRWTASRPPGLIALKPARPQTVAGGQAGAGQPGQLRREPAVAGRGRRRQDAAVLAAWSRVCRPG